jgi:hypothetical protein
MLRKLMETAFPGLFEALEGAAFIHRLGSNTAPIPPKDKDLEGGVEDNYVKWVILITIGFECFTKYPVSHNLPVDFDAEAFKEWIKVNADLKSYPAEYDFDLLATVCGRYEPYM